MAPLTGTPPVVLPVERGGWWHEYVCPAHGVELVHTGLFDGTFPPDGVPCRYGCRVDTPAVRGAWLVLAHQACARRLRLLAHTGERVAAVRGLVEYAGRYGELTTGGQHEQAADWMLRGRLFHQALTEAIWATTIGHTVWTLAEERTDDLAPVLSLLDALCAAAVAARDTLIHKGQFTSNYTAWLNAAGAVTSRSAALVRGTPWDSEWLTGEHGVFAHLSAATGPDGWEWEASTYYHGFVLRAVLLSLRGTDPAALPADGAARLRAMIGALAGIATDGGILPAVHDGPYVRPALALEWLELAALAGQFAGDRLAAVAGTARRDAGEADDGLDILLTGWFTGPPLQAPDVPRAFPVAGLSVVRAGGVHAVLDYGTHGGGHGHRDKLALSLYGTATPWQPDPGQVPYSHAPLRAYYASTAAHPAFSVDGVEQAECAGELAESTSDSATAVAHDCYPGVRAARRVVAGDGYLLDVVGLAAERERDLTVHLRPDCTLSLRMDGHAVRSTWVGEETMHGWHVCTVPSVPLLRPDFGPADNPQRTRTHVDWTAHAAAATFCSVYQAGGPTVTAVRLAGTRLVVEHGGGETAHEIGDLPC